MVFLLTLDIPSPGPTSTGLPSGALSPDQGREACRGPQVTWVVAPRVPTELSCCAVSTGVWAGAVGRMAGVKVPLVAMHHAYVVTERIEGIQVGGAPEAWVWK